MLNVWFFVRFTQMKSLWQPSIGHCRYVALFVWSGSRTVSSFAYVLVWHLPLFHKTAKSLSFPTQSLSRQFQIANYIMPLYI